MDSIIDDDKNNNEDEKPSGAEGGSGEKPVKKVKPPEVEVIKPKDKIFDTEAEHEERKKQLADMIPDEFFAARGPRKKGGFGCFNCMLITVVLFLIVVMVFLLMGVKVFKSDFFSTTSIANIPVNISEEEKASLDSQLEDFIKSYGEYIEDPENYEPKSYDLVLTQNQANYLLNMTDRSIDPKNVSFVRIYPLGKGAELRMSIPFNKKSFMNVRVKGEHKIEKNRYVGEIEDLRVGSMSKSKVFESGILKRIKREVQTLPSNQKYPFIIDSMYIKDSKIYVRITPLHRRAVK